MKKTITLVVVLLVLASFPLAASAKQHQRSAPSELNAQLLAAAEKGDVRAVQSLLASGAQVDAQDKDNWTALHLAALHGHENVASVLLSHGANVNALDKDGKTPLFWSAFPGHLGICRLLIDAGAKVNVRDRYGSTPLHSAAFGGHPEVADLLLQRGAKVNARTKEGKTPLSSISKPVELGQGLSIETGGDVAGVLRKHGGVK